MANTILVLGATGGIGSEVARAFLKRGWRVKAATRRPAEAAAKLLASRASSGSQATR